MENIFVCNFAGCSRAYSTRGGLARHLKVIHEERSRFQCDYCLKILSSRQNLIEHTNMHTGETPYICAEPGCELRFSRKSHLSAHRQVHLDVSRIIDGSPLVRLFGLMEEKRCDLEPTSQEVAPLPPIKHSQKFDRIPSFF